MGLITNKIYIYTSSEKNVVDNIDWNGLPKENYNGKTYNCQLPNAYELNEIYNNSINIINFSLL